MRVLHLTTEFPPVIYGGLGTAVGGLVAASARTGIEVAVLLVGAEGDPSYRQPAETRRLSDDPALTECRAAGVHLRPASHHAAEEMGVRWVQAWRLDVLHLHSFWLWPVARTIRERTGVPLVYTVHSLDRAEYEIGQGPPECVTQWQTQESAIVSADCIVALTRSERELIAAYLPIARERVRVVGNGIDDCPAAREAGHRRHQNDTPLVLYTGRFVERKGIRELLAAIPLVLAREPGTCFVLAGGHQHCSGEDMANYWLPPGLKHTATECTSPAGFPRMRWRAGTVRPTCWSCRVGTSRSGWWCSRGCCTGCRSRPQMWVDRRKSSNTSTPACSSHRAT